MTMIINVNACSVNGYISSGLLESDQDRSQYGLTCEADQQRVLGLLKSACAVITGSTSLKAAKNTWQVQNEEGRPVEWLVFTNKGIPDDLPFWEENGPRTLITSAHSGLSDSQVAMANSRGVTVIKYDKNPALELYNYLKQRSFKRTLLFGGGKINQLFFDAGLVSRIELTLSPVILASSKGTPYIEPVLRDIWKLKLVTSQVHGDHVFLTYDVLAKPSKA